MHLRPFAYTVNRNRSGYVWAEDVTHAAMQVPREAGDVIAVNECRLRDVDPAERARRSKRRLVRAHGKRLLAAMRWERVGDDRWARRLPYAPPPPLGPWIGVRSA
jgi:hypothetical protein